MDWVQYFFADKYHDLKLTHNLSVRQTGYHSANTVVPTGDIAFSLDNLVTDSTTHQSHVNQMMSTIYPLIKASKILGYQIKHLS